MWFAKARKTWLSGMSPAAAEFASACSAPGPVLAGAVVVAACVVVGEAACVVAATVDDAA